MRSLGTPVLVLSGLVFAACSQAGPAPLDGPPVTVRIAPLSLPGVGVACYDLEVRNGAGVVWSRGARPLTRLAGDDDAVCSDRFGNGAGGDVTYIGTCDADSDSDTVRPGVQNQVTLWVDGLYNAAVTADIGDWRNPCEGGCRLSVDCAENADAQVGFDLTIMRNAQQGFFDVAVNFEDVFCSAKIDTCDDEDQPLLLLPDPNGGPRHRTAVFGFACSAGADATTWLEYGAIAVTCGETTFALDPKAGPGNASVAVGPRTVHYGVYRGAEDLACGDGPGSCQKLFWNLAVSLDDLAAFGGTCQLSLAATATDEDTGFASGLPTGTGVSYPYIALDTTLTALGAPVCQQHPLGDGPLQPTYFGDVGDLDPAPPMCSSYDGATTWSVPGTAMVGAVCEPCDPALFYQAGTGTVADPYLICARTHLEHVAANLGARFRQVNDIDLGAAPFVPLGSPATPFSGDYDGGGHTLTALTIEDPSGANPAGLFSFVAATGVVHDLRLEDVAINGNNYVGAIAGRTAGTIRDVFVSGELNAKASVGGITATLFAGGLITHATVEGATIYSSASGSIIVPLGGGDDTAAAGIVAVMSNSTVTDSSVDADITWDPNGPGHAQAWTYAGGVVGYMAGNSAIRRTTVRGNVLGKLQVGGVAGVWEGTTPTFEDVHTSATVTGNRWVGGFGGIGRGSITRSSSSGNVTGVIDVGGFVGVHVGGTINNSYATGNVVADTQVGGFAGFIVSYLPSAPVISDCWSQGRVTANQAEATAGGFVGVSSAAGSRGNYPPVIERSISFSPSVTATAGSTSARAFEGNRIGLNALVDNFYLERPAVPVQGVTGLTALSESAAQLASSYVGLAFPATWRIPTANPLSPYTPALLTPVLAWQCGVTATCGP